MPKTDKPTCQVCKTRKVKCDGQQPKCRRCIKSRRLCTYEKPPRPITFRHSKFSVLGDQELLSPRDIVSPRGVASPSRQNVEPQAEHQDSLQLSSPYFSVNSSLYDVAGLPSPATEPLFNSDHDQAQALRRQPVDKKLEPIEGELLQFYVEKIGPWLDVTSPQRHFTYTVPRVALRSKLLFYAVMSCSAHLYRLLHRDRNAELAQYEDDYQHQCLQLLIPVLNDVAFVVQDEVVLTTIVILRMSEQYEDYDIDRQYHLVPGAFSHFNAAGPSCTEIGGLREAIFYSYVRADIRMAILGQCGTRIRLDTWPLDTSYPQDDADWANRMTWLLVQVINSCYGSKVDGLIPRQQLIELVDQWKSSIPNTFEPYFFEDKDDFPFPKVLLLAPWHIVGHQFYHASKILLAIHAPQEGSFSGMLAFNRRIQSDILCHARMLCAISFSNQHFGCRINASHLVATGAQFFTGKLEQRQVLNYFRMLQEDNAWPSRACYEMLATAYGETV